MMVVFWGVIESNGHWYCTRPSHRVPESFLCASRGHAEEATKMLNRLIEDYEVDPLIVYDEIQDG